MARAKDRLKSYRDKRDFSVTAEPEGKVSRKTGRRYLIQKHDASRLHYDLRLEHDGVLLSWAVTKGPSLDPGDKRLAVRTEDHPIEYGDFEGVIAAGYGAGTVMLWDEGEWTPRGDVDEGLEKGALKFDLEGARLKGGWALILMKPASGKGRDNWLLVKERDGAADEDRDPRRTWTRSVRTGRSMKEIAADPGPGDAFDLPKFTPPQLARLADEPPDGDDWLHEVKYDGYRIQALIAGDTVRLLTRNGKDWTDRYRPVAQALARLELEQAAIDGELMALNETGHSDFSALQAGGNGRLSYRAFDLLFHGGEDLRDLPLHERKERLETLLKTAKPPLAYSDHISGRGASVIEKACNMALEGIVSKRSDAPYRSGRGRTWIKSKCVGRDEFVIGGYRKSEKAGRPFASLLLGEYEGDALCYRGRVGTGFSDALMDELSQAMAPLERKTSPFAEIDRAARRGAVWLTPRLVAQIAYTERTADGLLRHPSFLGLREDKSAGQVQSAGHSGSADSDAKMRLAGIEITSSDRTVYPETGITKGVVAQWYAEAARRILEFGKGRPASLVRCPEGLTGDCFFQKHAGTLPDEIKTVPIEEKDGHVADYILLDDEKGLVAAAQMGMLEVHLWGARADRLDRPDRLVMDLDPGPGVSFDALKASAREVRDLLAAAGLESFCLLTGGKGIHVVSPLERRQDWDTLGDVTKGLARRLAEAAPHRYVATASKSKREGRIFIDWLRNRRGATAIAPFSLRARQGATLATPIAWDELSRIRSGGQYSLANIRQRLSRLSGDPWAGYDELRQSINREVRSFLAEEA